MTRSRSTTKRRSIPWVTLLYSLILLSTVSTLIYFLRPHSLQINEISPSTQPTPLKISNTLSAFMEIPPFVVTTGYKQFNLTTNFGYGCALPGNILTDTIVLDSSNCVPALKANSLVYDPATMPADQDWKRSYDGIFSLHPITKGGKLILLSFDHGENVNENIGGKLYQNTVNPAVKVADCASGYIGGEYKGCWESYSAFVTTSWQYLDSAHSFGMANRVEEGPVVWPQAGYLQNGVRKSYGLRHPHGIVSGGYIYVFYNDASVVDSGTKLARSPLSAAGLPGTFSSYCNGSWVPSLPAGFDKSKMSSFYDKAGGCATSIIPTGNSQTSFAVTAKTTGGYLGVLEESAGTGSTQPDLIKLYSSTDLINWTFQKTVFQTSDYPSNTLHYPIFLNQDGSSSALVNPDQFYILGAKESIVYALPVSLPEPLAQATKSASTLYSKQKNNSLLSLDVSEKNSGSSTQSFKVWSTQSTGLSPVYRLRYLSTTKYLYATNTAELPTLKSQGWSSEGIQFYAASSQLSGTIPLYKLKSRLDTTTYSYTSSKEIKQTLLGSGYLDEGIAFYVQP